VRTRRIDPWCYWVLAIALLACNRIQIALSEGEGYERGERYLGRLQMVSLDAGFRDNRTEYLVDISCPHNAILALHARYLGVLEAEVPVRSRWGSFGGVERRWSDPFRDWCCISEVRLPSEFEGKKYRA
jgi:hypothetical protein